MNACRVDFCQCIECCPSTMRYALCTIAPTMLRMHYGGNAIGFPYSAASSRSPPLSPPTQAPTCNACQSEVPCGFVLSSLWTHCRSIQSESVVRFSIWTLEFLTIERPPVLTSAAVHRHSDGEVFLLHSTQFATYFPVTIELTKCVQTIRLISFHKRKRNESFSWTPSL